MTGYAIVDHLQLDTHITFFRVEPINIEITLKEILQSLSDMAWIHNFDLGYLASSYHQRAEESVAYIARNIIKSTDDAVTSSSGEYVVSELARVTIVENMQYLNIPLAELFKEKSVKNHGFDFYTRNLQEILLFGEAKYSARDNSYGESLKQIIEFIGIKQDNSDLPDIDRFCCDNSKQNFLNGHKGYISAFSTKNIPTDQLIRNIKANSHFVAASSFRELICVAVNI
jgi:hypothetical protein